MPSWLPLKAARLSSVCRSHMSPRCRRHSLFYLPHRRRLQPRRMKAALVANDVGVQAARSQLLSDDSSSQGRGEEGGAGGHREVSSHRGDGCAAGKSVRGCVRVEEALFWDFFSSLMELDLPVDAHLNVSSDISSPPVKYGPFRRRSPSLLAPSLLGDERLRFVSTEQIGGGKGLVTSVFKFWRRLRQKLLWRRRRRRVSDEWRVMLLRPSTF